MQALIKRKQVWLYQVDLSKGNYQRQRVTLHHVNPPRRKLKVYVPNKRAAKYVKQKLIELKRITDKYTIKAGN